MRALYAALFVMGIWLFSSGMACAQTSIDALAAGKESESPVARACHLVPEPHVTEARAMVAAPAVPSEALPRLRTLSDALGAVVMQAIARSTTFRQLVQTINRTDGIVYVEHGRCGHGVRACLLDVRKGGDNRLVRVRVAENTTDWDLMGSVGHELQHAVEVLRNPAITTTTAMHLYYLLQGRRVGRVFETAAAIRAGNDVRAEVRASPRHLHPGAGCGGRIDEVLARR